MIFDYEPGEHFGVVHITIQLHMTSPQYIFSRIEKIKASETKRVPILLLLINADINTPSAAAAFSSLQIDCMSMGVQIVPAYTPMECAKYIENMHTQEMAPGALRNYKDTVAQARRQVPGAESELSARKVLFLSAIPKISKTDAVNLLASKSIRQIAQESKDSKPFSLKGIGKTKQKDIEHFFVQNLK
ncbi:DNA excision repair protein ERCC-1 [Nematocida minor]|uniref:DNA excision repair protein ERCC-1 n=1 Tax=Nematocida minor TaxID=1912983 RepID=UPI002220ACAD|nr:DNA excision repair protein ERCC-1 [Nematocida minor]KAI5190237.1 DNA excision repair protein ERCC-1 [Nematocida minor]